MSDGTVLPCIPLPDPMDPAAIAALTFLGQYHNENTRAAYAKDLEMFFSWCASSGLQPLAARRMHIQAYAIWLGHARGNSPKSIQRRVGTVAGMFRTAVIDGLVESSPAQFVRLPKVHDDPSRRPCPNRWELGAIMKAAKDSRQPADWALITLLATIGMRVSAACRVQLGDLTTDPSGYRWLHTVGKGGVPSLKVLPIPTWEAMDRARGDRTEGPLLLRRNGTQMTRRSAARIVDRLTQAAGVRTHLTPHSGRRAHVSFLLAAGVPLHIVQAGVDHANPATTLGYNRYALDPMAAGSHTMAAMLASTG